MDRPIVLIAMTGEQNSHVDALRRAGFEPVAPASPDEVAGLIPSLALAVVDCDLPADQVIKYYLALHNGTQVPTLLIVGDQAELPTGIGGAGTHDEIALKPVPPDSLVYRLQALLIRGGRHLPTESAGWATNEALSAAPIAGEGHVVSVFAPKGGVGKTTVAVNVAVALRQQTRAEVLLFDADVGVGNVTSVLDVPYRMGLSDLADSAPEEWTDSAFEQAVTTHAESGLRVLTWGIDPGQSERVSVDLLLAALRWGRNHHSYVLVDNHPGYDDRTMAMLAVSNEIFLVVTPEVGALRNSAQFLELARELGLVTGVRVIVNRANHGIRLADMSNSLGLPIAGTVVSNGPKAVIALNEGTPLVMKFPKERMATDLHRVARLISKPASPVVEESSRRRWWGRLGSKARASEA